MNQAAKVQSIDNVRKPSLRSGRFAHSNAERNVWVVNVETGVTRGDLRDPQFWAHVSRDLRPYDKIEVRCDDGSYFAELLVTMVGHNEASVHELAFHDLHTEQQPDLEFKSVKVEWKGPHNKWSVIRKNDGQYLMKGLPSKSDAYEWAINHEKGS